MGYDFHKNRTVYFEHQRLSTQDYIIPFIEKHFRIDETLRVLEIGCGEGGVTKAFVEQGCICTAVELSKNKFEKASQMLDEEIQKKRIELINKNIYDPEFYSQFKNKFDLIILKDVIEHIIDQKKLLGYLYTFLRTDGIIFFSFPPWQMPFGGHQQMCKSILKKTPWFHLLPTPLYKYTLKIMGESKGVQNGLIANKKTGISIESFESYINQIKYRVVEKKFYLFNPIYKFKFNLKPKEQLQLISLFPYLRNFLTTCVYYLVKAPAGN